MQYQNLESYTTVAMTKFLCFEGQLMDPCLETPLNSNASRISETFYLLVYSKFISIIGSPQVYW
jgi:hypothetical protein